LLRTVGDDGGGGGSDSGYSLEHASSLQGDLNKEIKWANVRRKADAEATKAAISKMEDGVNKRFDGNDIILKSFHQGKMLMESNLKMIMEKWGSQWWQSWW